MVIKPESLEYQIHSKSKMTNNSDKNTPKNEKSDYFMYQMTKMNETMKNRKTQKNIRNILIVLILFNIFYAHKAFPDVYEELFKQKRVIKIIDSGKFDLGGTPMSYKILEVRNAEEIIKMRKRELESLGFHTSISKNGPNIQMTAVRYMNEDKVDMVNVQGIESGETDYIIESTMNPSGLKNIFSVRPEKIKELKGLGFVMLGTDKQTYFDIPGGNGTIFIQFLPFDKDKAKKLLLESAKPEGWNEMDNEELFEFLQKALEKSGTLSLITQNSLQNIIKGKAREAQGDIDKVKKLEKQMDESIKNFREIMKDTVILTKNSKELIVRIEDLRKFPELRSYLQKYVKDAKTIVVQIMMKGGEKP